MTAVANILLPCPAVYLVILESRTDEDYPLVYRGSTVEAAIAAYVSDPAWATADEGENTVEEADALRHAQALLHCDAWAAWAAMRAWHRDYYRVSVSDPDDNDVTPWETFE